MYNKFISQFEWDRHNMKIRSGHNYYDTILEKKLHGILG